MLACAALWRKEGVPLHQKQKDKAMRNTEYNIDALGNMISSSTSFKALQDLVADLELEMEDALAI